MLPLLTMALAIAVDLADVTAVNVDCRADIAFVIDNSASISGFAEQYEANPTAYPNWKRQLTFVKDLVDQLNVGPIRSHIGVVDFGDNGHINFGLNKYWSAQKVKDGIDKITYKGERTNTLAGIADAYAILHLSHYGRRNDSVPKVIFLITDGPPLLPSYYKAGLPRLVEVLKYFGTRLVVITIGNRAKLNEPLLKSFASSDRDYFHVDNFKQLDSIKNTVIHEDTCKPANIGNE